MFIALDSGVINLLITPRSGDVAEECRRWMQAHVRAGTEFILPGIIHYERLRALQHALAKGQQARYLRAYEALKAVIAFLPLEQSHLDLAAHLWAEARRQGIQTAPAGTLDVDMILCAQLRYALGRRTYYVATTNVRHLAPFVPARTWETITP